MIPKVYDEKIIFERQINDMRPFLIIITSSKTIFLIFIFFCFFHFFSKQWQIGFGSQLISDLLGIRMQKTRCLYCTENGYEQLFYIYILQYHGLLQLTRVHMFVLKHLFFFQISSCFQTFALKMPNRL